MMDYFLEINNANKGQFKKNGYHRIYSLYALPILDPDTEMQFQASCLRNAIYI